MRREIELEEQALKGNVPAAVRFTFPLSAFLPPSVSLGTY